MKTSGTDRLIVFILCGIAFWGTAVIANANEEKAIQIIKLWPKDVASQDSEGMGTPKPDQGDGHIRLTDITQPSLRYFPAPGKKKPGPAVILCPGGGYVSLVTTKMTPIAKWLNDHGISAYILIYRAPKKRNEAFQDLQRAVRIVRSRASEWNIDPGRIGVMGSSAGGHLAAWVSTGFDIQTYEDVDELDGVSCKPDFTVLLYPAYMNKGEALSKEFTVTNEISPTLIVTARDDGFFPGSEIYAEALKQAGASIRVHFFEKGGHGFTLRPEEYPLSTWPDLCLQWFRDMDIIEEEAEQARDDGIKVSDIDAIDCDRNRIAALIHRIETNPDNRIDSLLIAKDGALVLERYFREAHIDQLHPVRSIIKGVLSLCVGKAIDEGKIEGVDDPILDYFPQIDRTKLVDGIDTWTIRDSLLFRSGLDSRDYKARLGKQRFERDTHVPWLLEQATAIDGSKPFQYAPHDPTIINHILSNATGQTFEEYAVEHFFEPMGISEYRFRTTNYGLTYPQDSLQMRSRDLLKLGLLIRNRGVWNGQQLLSEEYLDEATSPHARHKDGYHGYFWTLPDVIVSGTPIRTIMKHGAFGQAIYVVPDYGLVVVFTAGGVGIQKKGASEPRELRQMLQQDILPAFPRT